MRAPAALPLNALPALGAWNDGPPNEGPPLCDGMPPKGPPPKGPREPLSEAIGGPPSRCGAGERSPANTPPLAGGGAIDWDPPPRATTLRELTLTMPVW